MNRLIAYLLDRFLVAKLLLESLIRARTPRQLRDILSSLPRTLIEFYDVTLRRISDQDSSSRDLAFMIFTWLSHARRPLTAIELQHALAVEADSTNLDNENIVDTGSLLSVCAGLVDITAESNIITFVHVTVGEYFQNARTSHVAKSQTEIALTCLTYLGFDNFAKGRCANNEALQRRLNENAFLDYTARYWGFHVQEASSEAVDRAALKLLSDDARISSCSQIMLLPTDYSPRSNETIPENLSGLHMVAYLGLERLAQILLTTGSDIGVRDSTGRDPLSWAVESNHIGIVSLFLRSGADITSQDSQGRTPLALAAMKGYRDVAQLLLSRGADESQRDRAGQTALSLAATCGHLPLLDLLAAQPGSQIDSRDDVGRTPLLYAAEQGRDTIVTYLVGRSDVDINAQDDRGQTALIAATRRGQAEVVQILLANVDIKANLKDSSGRTAIMWAAIEGNLDVLKLLLSRDDAAEVLSSVDYSGRTPLDWATIGQHESVRKLLLFREEKP